MASYLNYKCHLSVGKLYNFQMFHFISSKQKTQKLKKKTLEFNQSFLAFA